jgi:cobalamin biosynthesis protein CobD/CbiB
MRVPFAAWITTAWRYWSAKAMPVVRGRIMIVTLIILRRAMATAWPLHGRDTRLDRCRSNLILLTCTAAQQAKQHRTHIRTCLEAEGTHGRSSAVRSVSGRRPRVGRVSGAPVVAANQRGGFFTGDAGVDVQP